MRSARNAYPSALGVALLCIASPAVARADGGLDGLAELLALLLAEAIAAVLGVAGVLAALLSRSRAVWLLALFACAANGVLGVVALVKTAARPFPLPGFGLEQVALGFVAFPSLILWRRTEPASPTEARSTHLSQRWLLLWILGHAAVAIVVSRVGWPLLVALLSDDSAGRAESVHRMMLVSALLNGILSGLLEWRLLRISLRVGALWIACTALGKVAAAYVVSPLGSQFAAACLVGGAVAGAAQWPLLRGRLMNAWLWVPALALASLAHWPLVLLLGSSPSFASILGPTLTGLEALLTGVALQRLARRAAP